MHNLGRLDRMKLTGQTHTHNGQASDGGSQISKNKLHRVCAGFETPADGGLSKSGVIELRNL